MLNAEGTSDFRIQTSNFLSAGSSSPGRLKAVRYGWSSPHPRRVRPTVPNPEASSPSFTLVHEYAGGRLPLHHFDFYRLKSPDELMGIGYDDSLGNGAILVEWGDKFPEALPTDAIRVRIEIQPGGGRRVRVAHQP